MKRTMMVLAALLMLSAVTFGQGLQKGNFAAQAGNEGWTLASGTGERVYIEFVTFNKPFDASPEVLVSLTGYDATTGSDGSVKLNLIVDKITKAGCIIKVVTWGDTKITGVFGNWLAMPK